MFCSKKVIRNIQQRVARRDLFKSGERQFAFFEKFFKSKKFSVPEHRKAPCFNHSSCAHGNWLIFWFYWSGRNDGCSIMFSHFLIGMVRYKF